MSWQLASFLLVALALAGGLWWYERTRPPAKVVAVIATLAALAALGRDAFAALPDVKPTTAIVLVAGYAFGAPSGFAVGALGGARLQPRARPGAVDALADARLGPRRRRRRAAGSGHEPAPRPVRARVRLRARRRRLRGDHRPVHADRHRRAVACRLLGGRGAGVHVQRDARRRELRLRARLRSGARAHAPARAGAPGGAMAAGRRRPDARARRGRRVGRRGDRRRRADRRRGDGEGRRAGPARGHGGPPRRRRSPTCARRRTPTAASEGRRGSRAASCTPHGRPWASPPPASIRAASGATDIPWSTPCAPTRRS